MNTVNRFGRNGAIMSAMAGETHRALFDERLVQTYFPRVKVTVMSCRQSVWLCLWVTNRTRTLHDEFVKRGKMVRQTQFIDVEGANHFVRKSISSPSHPSFTTDAPDIPSSTI